MISWLASFYLVRARGEERADSDWDLLVIAKELPDKPFERHLFLKRLLPAPCRGAISILAKTPAEFEQRVVPLYLDIAPDGRILYDPLRSATDRLAALRRTIENMGLKREHTMAGDMWRWFSETNCPLVLRWE